MMDLLDECALLYVAIRAMAPAFQVTCEVDHVAPEHALDRDLFDTVVVRWEAVLVTRSYDHGRVLATQYLSGARRMPWWYVEPVGLGHTWGVADGAIRTLHGMLHEALLGVAAHVSGYHGSDP